MTATLDICRGIYNLSLSVFSLGNGSGQDIEWNRVFRRFGLLADDVAKPRDGPDAFDKDVEDVFEFSPEGFIQESVEDGVQASGAHAQQVTHGVSWKAQSRI